MYLVLIISTLLAVFYALLFDYFKRGWDKKKDFVPSGKTSVQKFSILIPARNEEQNIIKCLDSLARQTYPKDLYEVIVLDDYSTDATVELTREFTSKRPDTNITVVKMSDFPQGTSNSFKKASIQKGIELAKHEWIITTDADCIRNANWLDTIAMFIEERNPLMVSAPVLFSYDKSFFQQAQALEFLGLIAIGGACINSGKPILCNGANLIYKKEAFYAVNGFSGIDGIASGDDELLMHKIHEQFPGRVHFLKNTDAIVRTNPCLSVSEFIAQRKRWVSKSTHYSNKGITLILSLSYLFNLCIFLSLLSGIFMLEFLWIGLIMLLLKIMLEYSFYSRVIHFFGEEKLLRWCIPASLVHVVYVLFIGIYGNFGGYNWKDRKVR